MDQLLKPEERELVKLVSYFKKRASILIIENKLGEEYKQLLDTCDKLVEQLDIHAKNRQTVLDERELLRSMVRDNAHCPNCKSASHLKLIGTEKNDKGWQSNKYKCRSCNITFVWNAPNNPWDMIPYVEKFLVEMEGKLTEEGLSDDLRLVNAQALEQMKKNLEKLKPVVEASDKDFTELEEREKQMADMVNKFKKHLMIEKIRMEE
jgi:acetolactate synthase small subunit